MPLALAIQAPAWPPGSGEQLPSGGAEIRWWPLRGAK
jgi:hypothetical protein